MKIVLNEEITKVVRPSSITITMPETEAHDLLEQLANDGVPDQMSPKSTIYKLWKGLDEEIGQR